MEFLTDPQLLIAFFTLTALELVLGIDNVIFISILVDKLPPEKRAFARRLGLFLAMFMRLALLAALSWMAGMTEPLVTVLGHGFSGRDLILLGGGLFLVWKSTQEVHQLMEGEEGEASSGVAAGSRSLAITRNTTSRSVKMPTSRSPCTTSTAPALRVAIRRAASLTVVWGGAVRKCSRSSSMMLLMDRSNIGTSSVGRS